jgi:hypothetical protein
VKDAVKGELSGGDAYLDGEDVGENILAYDVGTKTFTPKQLSHTQKWFWLFCL